MVLSYMLPDVASCCCCWHALCSFCVCWSDACCFQVCCFGMCCCDTCCLLLLITVAIAAGMLCVASVHAVPLYACFGTCYCDTCCLLLLVSVAIAAGMLYVASVYAALMHADLMCTALKHAVIHAAYCSWLLLLLLLAC